jgi:23S rRNA (cytosine1962-C5)-methyltransferase
MVLVSPKAASQIRQGSLWIFSNEFKTRVKNLHQGDWVEFYCDDRFVGYGYVNPNSLICGRVVSQTKVEDRTKLFIQKIRQALYKRDQLEKNKQSEMSSQSRRLIFSESDELPGFILDQYGEVLVLSLTTAGADTGLDDFIKALLEVFKEAAVLPKFIVARGDSSIRHLEGAQNYKKVFKITQSKGNETSDLTELVFSGLKPDELLKAVEANPELKVLTEGVLTESGTQYAANFIFGQKNGILSRSTLKSWIP